ncbi:hypothetical protein [Actinomadura sediminis]|uniref:Formate hydrogenlyase regulatory protein HycA n=1 Tax=Actinomadura sediminis TaxID=1038904 RepID=A0ABW3EI26_9ACTN
MAVPDLIPIAHEPEYRTATIGRYAEGQFFGSITYAMAGDADHGEGWEDRKRLFVVLHRFDFAGRHLESDVWCAGTWREQQRRPHSGTSVVARAEARMGELLDALPGREYADISVRPFRVVVDGVLFGLVIERHGEEEDEDDWAELYPDRLGFCAPWDGEYST